MNRLHAVRTRSSVSTAAVLLATAALFVPGATRADFPFPPTPHELHHDVRALVHDVLRTLDRIPVEIHGGYAGNLEPFLVGNVYFGPHRHYHATYSFPVWIDGGVAYRPYIYCNSRLYGSYAARPQFWSGWGVESQGHWCGHHHAYYPTVHACFRPQYRQHHDHGYGYGSGYGSGHRSDHRSEYRAENRSDYRPQYRAENGSGYRPQVHSNQGSGYRSSAGPHANTHNRAHSASKNRADDSRHRDKKGHDDGGRHRH